MNHLLEAALHYKNLGYSVIPVDSNKKSIVNWKKYQYHVVSQNDLEESINHSQTTGIAIICGKISNNLEVIDLDEKNDIQRQLFRHFIQKIELYNPVLLAKLTIATTRNKGYHFFYKCKEVRNYTLLAKRLSTSEELQIFPEYKHKVLIETRANGGYILVHPSPGYSFIQNSLENIPLISSLERQKLFEIARSFNEIRSAASSRTRIFTRKRGDPNSPVDQYNTYGDVISLLEKHGWKVVKTTPMKTHLQRPGYTEHQTSGDFHHGLGLFTVFTPSTEFEPYTGYRPFAVYTILECDGNFKLGAKRLLEAGYGTPYKNQI